MVFDLSSACSVRGAGDSAAEYGEEFLLTSPTTEPALVRDVTVDLAYPMFPLKFLVLSSVTCSIFREASMS